MPLSSSTVVNPARTTEVAGVLEQTRPETAVIARPGSTKSASGGDTETFNVVASGVPVRIRTQGRTSQSGSAGEQERELSLRELSFDDGTDVRPRDRVYIGVRTFDVEESASESYDGELRVLCVEVTS
jgi:hypothetical protein